MTGEKGRRVAEYQYASYGEITYAQPRSRYRPFLFNGQYGVMSDRNGLYYMRARYYSPNETRRFINQDVLLGNVDEGQSLNRFAYVTGQPINYIDPFGLGRFCVRPLSEENSNTYIKYSSIFLNPVLRPFDLALEHEQYFYDDGSPGGSQRWAFNEPMSLYQCESYSYDDEIMHRAEDNIEFGEYDMMWNNCQAGSSMMRSKYWNILQNEDMFKYIFEKFKRNEILNGIP